MSNSHLIMYKNISVWRLSAPGGRGPVCLAHSAHPILLRHCCKISMFLASNSSDLYTVIWPIDGLCSEKNNLFLARFSGISANSNENYSRYNFQVFANFPEISGNFRKISGNIKFPENLQ